MTVGPPQLTGIGGSPPPGWNPTALALKAFRQSPEEVEQLISRYSVQRLTEAVKQPPSYGFEASQLIVHCGPLLRAAHGEIGPSHSAAGDGNARSNIVVK